MTNTTLVTDETKIETLTSNVKITRINRAHERIARYRFKTDTLDA